jgi:hypothetical protein
MLKQYPYFGQRAVLTTMHGKGDVISPALETRVGLSIQVNSEIDTDTLGTFTGETTRKKDMLETAIEKAQLGMTASYCKLGIASEGSFGPHPVVPFMAINRELIVLVDDLRDIIIREMFASENTNFSSVTISPDDDISDFLRRVQFPEHALVVGANKTEDHLPLFKGVREPSALQSSIMLCANASNDGMALLQTDMRANFNPSRMKVIQQCAEKLAARIASLCPNCKLPGWGMVDVERGLPCKVCGDPSNLIKSEILGCVRCAHRAHRERSDGVKIAEQIFCLSCNP